MNEENQIKYKMPKLMFEPDPKRAKALNRLKAMIVEKHKIELGDFWSVHKWSVENIPEFWDIMWEYSGIICSKKYDQVVDLSLPMWETEWFRGARLNYAENLVKYRDDRLAIISAGEDKETTRITYSELYNQSCLYAAAFRKIGLKKGDVVACYMSNRPEAIYAMIGVVSVGAIWTGALPLIGAKAVIKKLAQMKPKILLTIDRFLNDGVEIDMLPKIKDISKGISSLQKVVIVPSKENSKFKDITEIRNSIFLGDFLNQGERINSNVPDIEFEQVPLSHPVFVNFTSGTTGLPKPLIHGSGVLLSIVRDFRIHPNASRDTRWYSISPVGWASWTMFASLHSTGCSLLQYEGVPYWHRPDYRVWDMVDEFGVTHLFLPASVVDELEKRGHVPLERNHLKSLEVFLAGGSVVKQTTYDFVYNNLPKHVTFSSAFGGTELLGSCLLNESTLPVYRGEIPSVTLGNIVKAVDSEGNELQGEVGDLVMTTPTPNLLNGIWGDDDKTLLKQKYFMKYPGTFSIGDYGVINPVTKGTVICCRSDETLKQRGCRFGSSEIYNIVDRFPEVRGSLCVSQYSQDMDERAVLFLRMRHPYQLDKDLDLRIRDAISRELTDRHVPDVILETQDIPMSINGKKMELVVKGIINNLSYNDETVANRDSLKLYENIPELQGF